MPSTEVLLAFLLAAAVFAYVPGPSMLYATAQTLAYGKRTGWLAALGLHIGGYIHVFAAAIGLAILFQVVPGLYIAMKLAGAAYLVWLGLRMILSDGEHATERPEPKRRAFWNSMTVEILNPKTAVFYLAFLPLFVDPTASLPIWAQFLVLGTIVNIMFSSADAACVMMADRLSKTIKKSGDATLWIRKACGGILIGLGGRLMLERV